MKVGENSSPINTALSASKEEELNQEFLSDLQIGSHHLENRNNGGSSKMSIKINPQR